MNLMRRALTQKSSAMRNPVSLIALPTKRVPICVLAAPARYEASGQRAGLGRLSETTAGYSRSRRQELRVVKSRPASFLAAFQEGRAILVGADRAAYPSAGG